jgi:hypothetical protein
MTTLSCLVEEPLYGRLPERRDFKFLPGRPSTPVPHGEGAVREVGGTISNDRQPN